jgi:hypothetical protein
VPSTRNSAALLAVFSMMVFGCTRLVDSDAVQCSVTADCTQRGFTNSICVDHFCKDSDPKTCTGPDCQDSGTDSGAWSCLGKVVWPSASSGSVTAVVNFADIITSKPVSGLTAQLCRKLDTTCSSPLLTNLVTDSSGKMTFSIESGFDGYLASTSGGIMPFLYYFYPPLTSNREVPNVPILQESALAMFATLAGGNINPDRGHVMARAYNCVPQTAEGVHFSSAESDSATSAFYMIKGYPTTKASETDSSGNGGLINLPPGTATLTGKLDNGETMGTIGVMTVAGRMTFTSLVPAPR